MAVIPSPVRTESLSKPVPGLKLADHTALMSADVTRRLCASPRSRRLLAGDVAVGDRVSTARHSSAARSDPAGRSVARPEGPPSRVSRTAASPL